MSKSSITRRRFLAGTGAAGTALVGLPYLNMIHGRRARAQSGSVKRFLMIHSPQGFHLDRWLTDWSTGALTAANLGEHLQPLQPHLADIHVIRGLQSNINYHTGNMAGFSSGLGLVSDGYGKSISVDQAIANRIGMETRHKSLEFGVMNTAAGGRSAMVFPGPNQVLRPNNNPAAMFDKIFADGAGSGDNALRDYRFERKLSILDSVTDRLATLRTNAGPDDRRRLDAHVESIREIEMSIMNTANDPVCAPPSDAGFTAGIAEYRADRDNWFRTPSNFGKITRHQMQLIGKAFQCDTTRVASLTLQNEPLNINAKWLESRSSGISGESLHTHKHSANNHARAYEAWVLEQLSFMLDQLQAEDFEGNRVIDNTVVYFGSGLPFGAHASRRDYGVIVAGQGGGFFRTGRALDLYNPALSNFYGEGQRARDPDTGVVYRNRLLLTFLRAFGLQNETFGSAAHSAGGPLDEGLVA